MRVELQVAFDGAQRTQAHLHLFPLPAQRGIRLGKEQRHLEIRGIDLRCPRIERRGLLEVALRRAGQAVVVPGLEQVGIERDRGFELASCVVVVLADERSEEHTSELQSLMRISYAVFCLKKKTNKSQELNKY